MTDVQLNYRPMSRQALQTHPGPRGPWEPAAPLLLLAAYRQARRFVQVGHGPAAAAAPPAPKRALL